jgi:hypothetical protein
MNARTRYDYLTRNRTQFLDVAVQCSKLTLPYLIQEDELSGRNTYRKLITPWAKRWSKRCSYSGIQIDASSTAPSDQLF